LKKGILVSTNIEKRADYVDLISSFSGLSKVEATKLFDEIKDGIVRTLRRGGRVSFFDLGVVTAKARAPRVGRNPKTGEPLQIAASNAAVFKAGKVLKEALNSGEVLES